MAKKIQYGNLYIEVPDDHIVSNLTGIKEQPHIKNEKSEEPEKLVETPYIYRPNDPFQASLDNVHALSNIDKVDKPWIRNTFLIFFIVIPLFSFEICFFIMIMDKPLGYAWGMFILSNIFISIILSPYFAMWNRARNKSSKKNPPEKI